MAAVGAVSFDGRGRASIPLIATSDDSREMPAEPRVQALTDVSVSFSGWSAALNYSTAYKGDYARWCAVIYLQVEPGGSIVGDDYLDVTFHDGNVRSISLTGRNGPPSRH